jgi:GNAT superfamily N-acetyltransferase
MFIRVMTERDLPAGLRLNTAAGWNQTAADWQRFLEHSARGCFVMEHDTQVVGTVTTISYEHRFAWIGMVLVDPDLRKQGIGTKLLEHAIEYLDSSHIQTLKLDATPAGKPLYEKLGFVTEYEIERWILKRPPISGSTPLSSASPRLTPAQLEEILKLDRELFGADRSFLLRSLHDRAPELAMALWENERLHGYTFGRHGLFADHLGPWMAANRTAAETLLQAIMAKSRRDTVIVDCLQTHSSAVELLHCHGFTVSRPLTRMFRGANEYPGKPNQFCAILGPEFG